MFSSLKNHITARWLYAALLDWAVILAGFLSIHALWTTGPWPLALQVAGTLAAVVVIGARQHALALLSHEGVHRLVHKNRTVNDLLAGLLTFWPLGITVPGYREFHWKHHRSVGTAEDPEHLHNRNPLRLFGLNVFRQWRIGMGWPRFVLQVLGDCIGGGIPHFLMITKLMLPENRLALLAPALTALGIWGLAWAADALWVPVVWYGALLTTFWIFFRIRIWLEHVGAEEATHLLTANALERFFLLPHNTWAHYEHHKIPGVPFWKLPTLRSAEHAARALPAHQVLNRLIARRPQSHGVAGHTA